MPEIYQATTPPSRDITGYEKTDFLVFLDHISKLTDDIKYLQSKIDIINDKNEKLLAQNFELRLKNIKLTSCVHTPPPSSFSTANKEAISRDTTSTQTAYGKRNDGKDNVCTIPVRADNTAEILEPTVTKRKKKDKQKEGISSIEREECMFSLNGTGGKSQSKENINSPINNYHEANSKDYNKLGSPMKTVPTNPWRKQRAYEETTFPSPSQTPSFAKRLPTNDENMIANNKNNQLQNKEGGVWPRNTILITGDSMLSNINERTLSRKYKTKIRSFPGATVSDMFDYTKPLLKKRPEKIILVIGANDIEHKMYQEIIAEIKSLVAFIQERLPGCHVVISEVFKRADKKNLNSKIANFNKALKVINCDTLQQQNITFDLLGKRGFHLNFYGNRQLAMNIINKLRSFSF